MAPLRLAVIGVGHLGQHHARILAGLPDVELVGVADTRFEQAQRVAQRCGTRPYASFWPLLSMVDAAVVAVPTILHHPIAQPFLAHGIPLLIEKPLAARLADADDLVELAQKHGTVLQVGHVERFNPAFEELERRRLQPRYIDCLRAGPFTGRSTDIGAVLDMMIHDLDLVLALVRSPVQSVEGLGMSVLGGHEDLASARLRFVNGCVANLTVSRVHPEPVRTLRIWAAEGLATLDFAARKLTLAQPSAALRRDGLALEQLPPAERARQQADLCRGHIPTVELDCNHGDPLTRELEDFLRCVRTGARPRVDGGEARKALALADGILECIRSHRWESRADGSPGPPPPLPPPGQNQAA